MERIAGALLILFIPAAALRPQAPTNSVAIGPVDTMWSATLTENRRYLVYTPPSYNDPTFLPRR